MKRFIKVIVDILMTCLLILQMAFIYTGQAVHEWSGITLIGLFILHHLLNMNWFKSISKGKYSPVRILFLTTNSLMFLTVFGLMISGIRMSQFVVGGWLSFLSMSAARKLHMTCAYTSYLVISFHMGLHWIMVSKPFRTHKMSRVRKMTIMKGLRCIAVFIALYGMNGLYKHQILLNAFLINEFVFFNFEQPVVLFLLDYMAVMGLGVFAGHHFRKLVQQVDRQAFNVEQEE